MTTQARSESAPRRLALGGRPLLHLSGTERTEDLIVEGWSPDAVACYHADRAAVRELLAEAANMAARAPVYKAGTTVFAADEDYAIAYVDFDPGADPAAVAAEQARLSAHAVDALEGF